MNCRTRTRKTSRRPAERDPALPVRQLRNLGPASAGWLVAVGIHTLADLRAAGAAETWRRVFEAGRNPSLNLLWALEGALRDEHWGELPPAVKAELRRKIAD